MRLVTTGKGVNADMKAIKASKKLISAIISFVLSLVLCVGVCLAWYSANNRVGAGSPNVGLIEGDIISFTVNAYYLDTAAGGYTKAATGNVANEGGLPTGAENVDANELGLLEDDDFMRPYGGLGNTFATAVLFEIEYELRTGETPYRIFASCPTSSALDVEDSDQDDTFTSGLSNAVGYYIANKNGEIYSRAGNTANKFIKTDDNTKSYVVVLKNDIVPTTVDNERGNHVGKVYVIMDYMPENFIYLSSLIIRSGGTLTSGLMLTGDLSINIASYDPDDPDIPVVPDPDPDETSEPIVFNCEGAVNNASYPRDEKNNLTEAVTIDIFKFNAGVRFEEYSGEYVVNTQGKDIDIVLDGRTSISFSATCASTSSETVISLYKDGVQVEDIGTLAIRGSAQSFTIENLEAGTYTIKTSSSARITNLTVR